MQCKITQYIKYHYQVFTWLNLDAYLVCAIVDTITSRSLMASSLLMNFVEDEQEESAGSLVAAHDDLLYIRYLSSVRPWTSLIAQPTSVALPPLAYKPLHLHSLCANVQNVSASFALLLAVSHSRISKLSREK